MKLSIVVLSSILAVCSATTAIPVNPSAAASAGASTSTVIPSAQTTPSTDLSQLPEEGMNLIKEYAQTKKSRDDAKKLQRKLQKLEQKLEQEQKNLDELIKKQLEFGCASLTFKLGKIKVQLVKYIFGKNALSIRLLHGTFDSKSPVYGTCQNIWQLLTKPTVRIPTRLLARAHSSSQQAPQGYDNSAFLYDDEMEVSENSGTMHSSSETPIVQPTQTSPNTQAASSSTQRLPNLLVYRKFIAKLKMDLN
ncbi:hypothetical protein BSLG_005836 [Batrachochytrium salamandrivorans]|nr:hypothetical protein BSLG_005836 [Batrachochytrium salamandrivorans]